MLLVVRKYWPPLLAAVIVVGIWSLFGYKAWVFYKREGWIGFFNEFAGNYSPGGALFSGLLVWMHLQPWQGFSLQIAVFALPFFFLAVRRSPYWRWLVGGLLPLFTAVAWWVTMSATVPAKQARGFPLATFTKMDERGERTLVFIGETHIADLEYFEAMDGEVARLTGAKYEFFYEEAPDFSPCMVWANISTYDRDWKRFFIDTVRTPAIFPSAHWFRHWHMVDLPSDAVTVIAVKLTGLACFEEMNRQRNDYILATAERSGYRNIALHYGADHLFGMRPSLVQHGWDERSIVTIPSDRPGTTAPASQ